jgi:23S rRNA (cytidine1920-2'-O)/16S rRNA (cytidine1409-2'-O)-methyltransferase
MDKTNARYLTVEQIGERVDGIVVDCSFISLEYILPPLVPLLNENGYLLALIKPQFEAGREQVGKGGVVRDEAVRLQVVQSIREFGESIGLEWLGYCVSPITGPAGNVEYTARWKKVIS